MDYQEHPETQSRLKLSHVLLILAVGGMLFAITCPVSARTRSVNRNLTPVPVEDRMSAPALGWTLDSLAGSKPYTAYAWKVRVVTARVTGVWTPEWINAHARISNGSFDVIAWLATPGSVCKMQAFRVPAQPRQSAEFAIDISKFAKGGTLMFEAWPGYDVFLEWYDGPKRAGSVFVGIRQQPPLEETAHPSRAQSIYSCK
jgi:hypothetical protein